MFLIVCVCGGGGGCWCPISIIFLMQCTESSCRDTMSLNSNWGRPCKTLELQILKQRYLKWNINTVYLRYSVFSMTWRVLEVLKMSVLQIVLVSAHSNGARCIRRLCCSMEKTKVTKEQTNAALSVVILLELSMWERQDCGHKAMHMIGSETSVFQWCY